jgi:nitrate reductase delta subunit
MERAELCDRLASLLRYPDESYAGNVAACRDGLAAVEPEASAILAYLVQFSQTHPVEELQELFVATFDLNPVCSLELGWHLYGENYDRGAFMVRMRGRLREHGLAESVELPDHLTHALPLLGRLEKSAAAAFWQKSVQPALAKMLASLEGRNNPLQAALRAIALALESLYGRTAPGEAVHA